MTLRVQVLLFTCLGYMFSLLFIDEIARLLT